MVNLMKDLEKKLKEKDWDLALDEAELKPVFIDKRDLLEHLDYELYYQYLFGTNGHPSEEDKLRIEGFKQAMEIVIEYT